VEYRTKCKMAELEHDIPLDAADPAAEEVLPVEETSVEPTTTQIKLFRKWSYDDVSVDDISLEDYIAVKPKFAVYLPHTSQRYQSKRFRKASCPIVERLVVALMFAGKNAGKKLLAVNVVRHAFEIIHLAADGANPIQVTRLLACVCVLRVQPRGQTGFRQRHH